MPALNLSPFFLEIGTTFASFQSDGSYPCIMDAWKNVVNIGARLSACSLIRRVGISSGSLASWMFRLRSSLHTPLSVTVMFAMAGCGLGPLSGIVLTSSSLLKTENCWFKMFTLDLLSDYVS